MFKKVREARFRRCLVRAARLDPPVGGRHRAFVVLEDDGDAVGELDLFGLELFGHSGLTIARIILT